MCEIAAYLAQLGPKGLKVAGSFMTVAAGWATQLEKEIEKLGKPQSGDSADTSQLRANLQTRTAIAHCCAIICLGYMCASSHSSSTPVPGMSKDDAAFLCLHRVQAYQKMYIDCSNAMVSRLSILTDQCSQVLASEFRALHAAVQADASLLECAVRSVFADLPQGVSWQVIEKHPGCYIAHSDSQVYAINVINGCVLCNGLAPGHLPPAIVQHAEYFRLFGNATFEVAQLQGKQLGMFRTVQSHGGFMYTFHLQGGQLYVAECPVDPDTGAMIDDLELELLPCTYLLTD